MFAGLKKQLRGQVYEYAHKFKKLFPDNKPEGAFDSLLEILLQLNDGDFASQIKEIFKVNFKVNVFLIGRNLFLQSLKRLKSQSKRINQSLLMEFHWILLN